MSKVAIKGADTGTGIFTLESPATNTDRTLVLPDEAGTVLTSGTPTVLPKGVPAFRAELQTSTSISTGTWTLVPLSTSVFDTSSCFDTSTYKYTPNVAGYYCFIGNVRVGAGSPAQYYSAINKNSTGFNTGSVITAAGSSVGAVTTAPQTSMSTIVYMNGTTDYVCLLGYLEGTSPFFDYNPIGFCNFLSGFLVRAT